MFLSWWFLVWDWKTNKTDIAIKAPRLQNNLLEEIPSRHLSLLMCSLAVLCFSNLPSHTIVLLLFYYLLLIFLLILCFVLLMELFILLSILFMFNTFWNAVVMFYPCKAKHFIGKILLHKSVIIIIIIIIVIIIIVDLNNRQHSTDITF